MKDAIWSSIAEATKLADRQHELGAAQFMEIAAAFSGMTGYHFTAIYGGDFAGSAPYISINGTGQDGYVRFIVQLCPPAYASEDNSAYIIRIADLFISMQGHGFGTALMSYFLQYMKEKGIMRVVLEASDNRAAAFWQQLGFRIDPERSESVERPSMYIRLAQRKNIHYVKVRIRHANQTIYEFQV